MPPSIQSAGAFGLPLLILRTLTFIRKSYNARTFHQYQNIDGKRDVDDYLKRPTFDGMTDSLNGTDIRISVREVIQVAKNII